MLKLIVNVKNVGVVENEKRNFSPKAKIKKQVFSSSVFHKRNPNESKILVFSLKLNKILSKK